MTKPQPALRGPKQPGILGCTAAPLFLYLAASVAFASGQPWDTPYTGKDATGDQVIALWQFEPGAEAKDNSGHGHDLKLRGKGKFVAGGKFGSCLESFPSGTDNDKPQGAVAPNSPHLTPPGPFTIEMWIKSKSKPVIAKGHNVFLLDKKYYHYPKDLPKANHDYGIFLRNEAPGRWRLHAWLGFGEDSSAYQSDVVTIEPGQWRHIGFVYDGAGTCRFYLDGIRVGRQSYPGRGPVSPGPWQLAIGERVGSTHGGFPGYIDQVRIVKGVLPEFAGTIELSAAAGRTTFVRMEKDAAASVVIANDTGATITDATAMVQLGPTRRTVNVAKIEPAAATTIAVPVNTTVRPDRYDITVTVTAKAGKSPTEATGTFPIVIVPRPRPNQMPVVMWGDTRDPERLKAIGFTHELIWVIDYGKVWKAGQVADLATDSLGARTGERLNQYLASGLGGLAYLYPGSWVAGDKERFAKYAPVGRDGQPNS